MGKRAIRLFLVVLIMVWPLWGMELGSGAGVHGGRRPACAPGELLVKYKSTLRAAAADYARQRWGVSTLRTFRDIGVHHVKLAADMTVEEALDLYRSDPAVQYGAQLLSACEGHSERHRLRAPVGLAQHGADTLPTRYWEANMAFLSPAPPVILRDPTWPVRTYKPQYPPTFVAGGDLRNSIVVAGGSFTDCRLVNSIVGAGVRIEPGADIIDSIVFDDVRVQRGARLRKVIIDKSATVPERFEIGFVADKDARDFKISRMGIRVVPKGCTCE